jgi:hypothetical protein
MYFRVCKELNLWKEKISAHTSDLQHEKGHLVFIKEHLHTKGITGTWECLKCVSFQTWILKINVITHTQQQKAILDIANILNGQFKFAAIFSTVPVSCYMSIPAVLHYLTQLMNTTSLYWGHSRHDGMSGVHLLPTAVFPSSPVWSILECLALSNIHVNRLARLRGGGGGGGVVLRLHKTGPMGGHNLMLKNGGVKFVSSWISFCGLSSLKIMTHFA